jgi:ribosome-binding protein aMBF1 (putative translation factor)
VTARRCLSEGRLFQLISESAISVAENGPSLTLAEIEHEIGQIGLFASIIPIARKYPGISVDEAKRRLANLEEEIRSLRAQSARAEGELQRLMLIMRPAQIYPEQCRAGRAWLGWSQEHLAQRASVSLSTVRDFERGRRNPVTNNRAALKRALETAGVVFDFDEEGSPTGLKLGPPLVAERANDVGGSKK